MCAAVVHACVVLPEYRPRRPWEGMVYQVVRDDDETFCAEATVRRDGERLPRFVDREFRGLLRCGQLAAEFGRFAVTAAVGAPAAVLVQGTRAWSRTRWRRARCRLGFDHGRRESPYLHRE